MLGGIKIAAALLSPISSVVHPIFSDYRLAKPTYIISYTPQYMLQGVLQIRDGLVIACPKHRFWSLVRELLSLARDIVSLKRTIRPF